MGFLDGSVGKESTCSVGRPGFDPCVGKIPWRRERLPTPVFQPGEFHGLYSPWGCKELDITERLSLSVQTPVAPHPGISTTDKLVHISNQINCKDGHWLSVYSDKKLGTIHYKLLIKYNMVFAWWGPLYSSQKAYDSLRWESHWASSDFRGIFRSQHYGRRHQDQNQELTVCSFWQPLPQPEPDQELLAELPGLPPLWEGNDR